MFTFLPWGYHSVLPLAHMNASSVDKLSPWGGASGNKSLNTDKELTLLKTSGLSNLPITRFWATSEREQVHVISRQYILSPLSQGVCRCQGHQTKRLSPNEMETLVDIWSGYCVLQNVTAYSVMENCISGASFFFHFSFSFYGMETCFILAYCNIFFLELKDKKKAFWI